MKLYRYIFSCAYWVSIHDLKERSAPQEYAFMFISVVGFLLFVFFTGVVNLFIGYNILTGRVVILSCLMITGANFIYFLRGRKYIEYVKSFSELSQYENKRKRLKVMMVAFAISAILALLAAVLNNKEFSEFVFE